VEIVDGGTRPLLCAVVWFEGIVEQVDPGWAADLKHLHAVQTAFHITTVS